MNFFKRALKYCVRQKLRTLILFLTFTLLSATVLIAVSSKKMPTASQLPRPSILRGKGLLSLLLCFIIIL